MAETRSTLDGPSPRPFYSRLALGGLATIFALMIILGIVQVSSGDTRGLIFLAINIAIVVIVGGLILRFGSWALVLGVIAGVFGTGFYLRAIPGSVGR